MNTRTLSPIPSRGRINAFDFLRSLMIFFVIVLHVSMTYMLETPAWWYVVSDRTSPVFVLVVNILDVFMMPVLFFLSGYFTPASYLRKGTVGFVRDKVRHILFPWLLGILVIVPLIQLSSGKSVSHIIGIIKENPFSVFHWQGHLWYLGVLFIFLTVYAVFACILPPNSVRTAGRDKNNKWLLLLFIILSCVYATLSSVYYTDFDNWIVLGDLFSLKPAKIVTYASVFVLGIYAWQKSWFTRNGWMPSIGIWRILAIGTMICYMVIRLLIVPNHDIPLLAHTVPAWDAVCSFTTMMYMLLIGIRFQKSRLSAAMVNLSPYSYGVYWVHMPLMVLYLYLINGLDFPIFLKWLSGITVTCIVSWLFSKYILRKVPLLKDMF